MTRCQEGRVQILEHLRSEFTIEKVYESNESICYTCGPVDVFVDSAGRARIRKQSSDEKGYDWTITVPREMNYFFFKDLIRAIFNREISSQYAKPKEG